MMEYDVNASWPDSWSVLEYRTDDAIFHKIIAGFDGSYMYGPAWRLNSGITKIDETVDGYAVHGNSGSVYMLHKLTEGVRGYASTVLADLQQQVSSQGTDTLEIVLMKDILAKYKGE